MAKKFRGIAKAILLSEGKSPEKVQLLRTGTFHHEQYGKFSITKQFLSELKKNFDAGVRGIDLAIDFAHENAREAAAWIKNLALSEDGEELWADVTWTKAGNEKVEGLEFRYLSAEFVDNYLDNESLKKFGPTLLGAGLTNRPVIKGMKPAIELSEGSLSMDELEETKAKLKAAEEKIAAMEAKMQASEAANKELADKVKVSEEQKVLAEKKGTFAKMLSEGKVCAAQEESFLAGDFAKFAELAQPVKLNAEGTGAQGKETVSESDDVQDQIEAKVKALCESDKSLSYGSAVSRVLSENADIAKKYYGLKGAE